MEVRTLYITSDKAPVSGLALYLVLSEEHRSVTLLHPITLSKFTITAEEYLAATEYCSSVQLWPVNPSGSRFSAYTLADLMELKMKDLAKRSCGFPAHIVRSCVASLRGVEITEIPVYKEASKPRGFAVRSEKRPGVIDAIVEMLSKGASVDEMVEGLKEKFPDRNGDGMKTTVRCQINRLPGKLARKMEIKDDKKRGKIYRLA